MRNSYGSATKNNLTRFAETVDIDIWLRSDGHWITHSERSYLFIIKSEELKYVHGGRDAQWTSRAAEREKSEFCAG